MEPVKLEIDARLDLVSALRFFLDHGVHAVAVTDETGEPIGVVSKTDVLSELYENPDVSVGSRRAATPGGVAEPYVPDGICVRDLMIPLADAVPESTSVARAIVVMARSGVHPVPIVGADGNVIGALSSADVLHWLVHHGIYG